MEEVTLGTKKVVAVVQAFLVLGADGKKENISELIYCEPESICAGCRLLDAVCGAAGSDLRLQSHGDC